MSNYEACGTISQIMKTKTLGNGFVKRGLRGRS